MITLPEILNTAVLRAGLSVHIVPEHPPGSSFYVEVEDQNGVTVGRKSFVDFEEDPEVISFLEHTLRKYREKT